MLDHSPQPPHAYLQEMRGGGCAIACPGKLVASSRGNLARPGELVIVTTYPSVGVPKDQHRWAKVFVSEGENEQSRHQRLFEENIRKTKKTVCGF